METKELVKEKNAVVFKSGFTETAFVALLFSIVVFMPANIYLNLMTGQAVVAAWFVTLLWVEAGKIAGKSITRHEAAMILLLSSWIATVAPTQMVFRVYFRNSDIVQLLGFEGQIPTWWVPHPSTRVQFTRSFLHPAWTMPIAIEIARIAFGAALAISLAFVARRLFVEVEDLPFPIQQVDAQAIKIVTSETRREGSVSLLFVFGIVGFIWGFFVYALPFVIESYTGQSMRFIPVPWADLSVDIGRFMPGAMLGVATFLAPVSAAFVLSAANVIGIIIGSFAIWFFGNWLIVNYHLAPTEWWVTGMNAEFLLQRSTLYFWAVPILGLTFAAGLFPLFRHPGTLVEAFKGLLRPPRTRRKAQDVYSAKVILVPMLLSLMAGIMLYRWLAPDFPPWIIAPAVVGIPIVLMLVNGRMLGETGLVSSIGDPAQIIYYASGYRGIDVWFVPNFMTRSGVGFLRGLKVAQLTETTAGSYVKMYLLCLPIAWLMGYFYVQMFWSLAPIPSGVYPGASIFWPIQAINLGIWIGGRQTGLFNPVWLLLSFIIGGGIYFGLSLSGVPISYVAIVAGAHQPTPIAVTYLIGLIASLIVRRVAGAEWFDSNKWLIAAGLTMGEAIAITIAVSVSLIINSIWLLPI